MIRKNNFTFQSIFEADTDLRQYSPNDLSIFALSLYLQLEDVHGFAADAITEGPNDKKIDILYIDESDDRTIIAQSYLSSQWGKQSAPANKASDLNTAMAWLLSASEDRIPEYLRTRAKELRSALSKGDITRIELIFIHNCIESKNVQDELKAAADATRDIVKGLTGSDDPIEVSYQEFGLNKIEELFRSRDRDILIDSWMDVPASDYVQETGQSWKAILTTVPAVWIRKLYKDHEDSLFSANYRDYLGHTKRQGNINHDIMKTAGSEPMNFWVYNNGITALTHELEINKDKGIRIRGISIINGAQTTGALGNAIDFDAEVTKVLIRIVACRSRGLIDNIIRYNNTQNEIKPADRRSNDYVQKRLAKEFSKYNVTYVFRRSSNRTPKNAIIGASIARVLCAFHGDPQTAYRNAKEIYNNDVIYRKVFPNKICAEHVFLVRGLSIAIDDIKIGLKRKVSDGTATQLEEQQYETLKHSAAKYFIFYLIGATTEEIMGRRVSDLYEWKCKPSVISPINRTLADSWKTVVRALLPQISVIVLNIQETQDPFYDVPRSAELSKKASDGLRALIGSLGTTLESQFDEIRQRTML